ncbi:MAG: Acylphosphatase [Candidatus Methanogasteraceae archaeon]|nr:MAG: Acylphosphatase [ANME-2 cluster archaeon]
MKKLKAMVSGNIQNVGYRAQVITIAKVLGLTGFVQNLDDGRVKIIAESEDADVDRFLDAIKIKNTLINVEDVEVEYADATGDFDDFYKLVGGGETDERLDKAAEYLKKLIDVTENGFAAVTIEMRTGFVNLGTKMDTMLEKQDAMLEKQNETTKEIKGLRGDMNSYMDRKFGEIEGELDLIKSALVANGMLDQGSIKPAATHSEN